jgi:NADP-dependent 3-hydroxy acid dehydrogenase YdfG
VPELGFASALVTGAGSGIGAATAEMLAGAGVAVTLVGRRPGPLAETAARIAAAGGRAVAVPGDTRKYRDLEHALEVANQHHGPVDLLVANAAIAEAGAIVDADPDLYADVVMTNVVGMMHSVRAVLPQLVARGSGHIVVIASISGRVTYTGESAYVASKHATVAFAECLRQEVAGTGIRISIVEPGLVETPLIHVYPGALDMVPDVVPLEPADVARAVRYILEQPPGVNVSELVIRPTSQVL